MRSELGVANCDWETCELIEGGERSVSGERKARRDDRIHTSVRVYDSDQFLSFDVDVYGIILPD